MPWILISKYFSLFLTPPPFCVSHAWLDWEAISTCIMACKVLFIGLFFTTAHTVQYLCNTFCVKQMSANHAEMLQCDCAQQVWGRAQYPIATRVQGACWQDISAGRCICTRSSSETLSAPTLHYHNALGSVKRPAVIWKGNYLLWNLLQQSKEGGEERVEGEWVPIGRGSW